MNTFLLSDLREVLIARNAFIYHGAAIAKGIGNHSTNSIPFLDRLKKVIEEDLEVCCSTVQFGDCELNKNFWGKIGLILWPKSHDSITLVSPKDAGTKPDENNPGRRTGFTVAPITSKALEDSIDNRPQTRANERCVRDYEVIGIFVEEPIQYEENGVYHDISLESVFRTFRPLKVYGFCDGRLREVLSPKQWGDFVPISDLYPEDDKV